MILFRLVLLSILICCGYCWQGWVVMSDKTHFIEKARTLATHNRWDARVIETQNKNDQRLLVCQKPFLKKWTTQMRMLLNEEFICSSGNFPWILKELGKCAIISKLAELLHHTYIVVAPFCSLHKNPEEKNKKRVHTLNGRKPKVALIICTGLMARGSSAAYSTRGYRPYPSKWVWPLSHISVTNLKFEIPKPNKIPIGPFQPEQNSGLVSFGLGWVWPCFIPAESRSSVVQMKTF